MKRTLTLLLCAAMVLTVLAGCNDSSDNGDALFTPGTFTGKGTGYGGTIVMEVTVDENQILSVEAVEHSETATISDPAFAQIPAKIVETQSIAVDTVAGCTASSNGIIEAVTAALEQTATDMTKLRTASAGSAGSDELIVKNADVVIVGAGGAGLSAAVEVLRANGSVIVIDKQPAVGGNTLLAGSALNTSNPEQQRLSEMTAAEMATIKEILATEPRNDLMKAWQDTLAAEIAEYEAAGSTYLFDSPSLHKLQTYIDGDYVGNPEIIDTYGDHTLEALQFLTDLGTEWEPGVNAAIGATWRRSHTPLTTWGSNGAGFVLPQNKFVEDNGGEIILNAKAEELIVDDSGRVTGVRGNTTSGQPFEITADKGVILATGGFGANVEMREHYNNMWPSLGANIPTSNGPQATGDGIVMAEAIGANLVGMEWIQLVTSGLQSTYIDDLIFVNQDGERFVKEDGRRDEICLAIYDQEIAWSIADGNTVIDGVSKVGTDLNASVASGRSFTADTLEELAEQIGVDPDTLVATVATFNTYVANTAKDPLGRSVYENEFGVGPFYATPITPVIHHTMGGIEINTSCEVIDTDGNVIPGLYAAGETIGGLHGGNRLGGNAITDVVLYGRIAGQSAAAA